MAAPIITYDAGIPYDANISYDSVPVVTMYDALQTRVRAQLQDVSVATAAGIDLATWQSSSAPRVFHGLTGMIGGVNRGRCPLIMFTLDRLGFNRDVDLGGTVQTIIQMRVLVACRTADLAAQLSGDICLAALAALRSTLVDNYMASGAEDDIGELEQGPFGHKRHFSLTVEHTFDRASYQQAP